MRIGFAGTPEFARTILAALIDSGQLPELVLTQPDRPQGRGMKLTASPVKQLAEASGLPVLQPVSLKTPEARAPLLAHSLDVLVVAAYGLILPREVLAWPCFGCVNVHASLLPRWRGAAPIHRAIEAGDAETGVTLMQMDAGLDTGAMIAKETIAIAPDDTTGSLHDKLAKLGAELTLAGLHDLEKNGTLPTTPQPDTGVTYASKISKAEAQVDWNRDAVAIDRSIRAFAPYPGAFTLFAGVPLKLWRAHIHSVTTCSAAPGTIVTIMPNGIIVACGKGSICISEVQQPGNKRLSTAAFVAGHPISAGTRLGK